MTKLRLVYEPHDVDVHPDENGGATVVVPISNVADLALEFKCPELEHLRERLKRLDRSEPFGRP